MKVAFDCFSLFFGVMFYMSRVLGTNVLIALNKLIESKFINGVMLLPPAQLEATETNTLLARPPLRFRMLNATYCTPTPPRALVTFRAPPGPLAHL